MRLHVMQTWVAVLLAATPHAASPGAQERTIRIGDRKVVVWTPAGTPSARQPAIIFSHGHHGCATQSRFLTRALAARGYWVLAPNHRDSMCDLEFERAQRSRPAFVRPELWSDKDFANRAADLEAVREAIVRDPELSRHIDPDRIGYAGHSLGGYTTLGMAGGWASWQRTPVKAVLALSPYVAPFTAQGTLANVRVPVMYQGGTRDLGITPGITRPSGAYDQTGGPKYLVSFVGAGHFAWSDLQTGSHESILRYALPFLDRYVKGDTVTEPLTTAVAGVQLLRYNSELGTGSRRGTRAR